MDSFSADSVKYFCHIPATPKRETVLTRIGYKKGRTELDEKYGQMVGEGMKRGVQLCNNAGALLRVKIINKGNSIIRLDNGLMFESAKLSSLLKDSGEVLLMAATAGRRVVETISSDISEGNPAAGVILDAVASQTADATIDWIEELAGNLLAREGRKLTRLRYSPGYGDLSLTSQSDIFRAMKLDKLDMEITEKYMLIPEKSVIAIAGIEDT